MTDLEKAITQKHLTFDTVEAQFCSDWLKDEITILFKRISSLEACLVKVEEEIRETIARSDDCVGCDEYGYSYITRPVLGALSTIAALNPKQNGGEG